MITIFPQNGNWFQANKGDLVGDLYATRNMNLENVGYITLSRRTSSVINQVSNASFTGTAYAMTYAYSSGTSRYEFTSAQTFQINGDLSSSGATGQVNGTFARPEGDMVIWNNASWYTGRNGASGVLYSAVMGGNYTAIDSTLLTNVPLPMSVFVNKNILCYASGNVVRSITTAGVITNPALTIPADFRINWMHYLNNRMYIGTTNLSGGSAYLFEWDGSSASANNAYPVEASVIPAGARYEQSIVLITSRGQILRFSGGGFTELCVLPQYEFDYQMGTESAAVKGSLYLRGIYVIRENLFINLDIQSGANRYIDMLSSTQKSDWQSGLYQYSPKTGLFHRGSISMSTSSSINDYGVLTQQAGAVFPVIELATTGALPSLSYGYKLLFGGKTYNSGKAVVSSFTSGENRGSFITTKVISSSITTNEQKLHIKFKNVSTSLDKIIVKYRTSEEFLLSTCTINSSTSITITYTGFPFSIGDEIELIDTDSTSSQGSGYTAHITNISVVGSNYTMTIDETLPVSSGSCIAKIYNFKRIGTISSSNTKGFQEFPIGSVGKWIQFKVEMRGDSEPAIEQMILVSKSSELPE